MPVNLLLIREKLNLQFGSWNDEEIEQLLCLKYIKSNMNILEIGSNIGRVSLIIAFILQNGLGNLVTLEKNNIEGDFIETGVWRGGASIFMAGLNKFYNLHRKVYVADSFEGLPPPNSLYPQDASSYLHEWSILSVSLDEVKSNFNKYNLLEENVVFIKGFFETSLKNVNFDKISLLRLDGDMYSSTIEVLNEMYYKVSIGGYIIIDDYGCTAVSCKEAVDDFRRQHNITSELKKIDWTGVYSIKE